MPSEQIEYDGNDRIVIAGSYNTIDEMLDALKKQRDVKA